MKLTPDWNYFTNINKVLFQTFNFKEELQDVSQNVVTLDGEVMAVNGRILAGHSVGNGRSLLAIGIEPETR